MHILPKIVEALGWRGATMLLASSILASAALLQSKPPGVASQAGRTLQVAPSSWTPVKVPWRLVKSTERDPRTARAESRWRADSSSVEATCRHFNVSLTPSPGLGISLQELVLGGGDTALPLTVVDGLIEGSAAAAQAGEEAGGACVMEGDTLIAVHGQSGLSFDVEGLLEWGSNPLAASLQLTHSSEPHVWAAASYDDTVDAIGKVICSSPGSPITLTLGRIVRRGRAVVTTTAPDGSQSVVVCYEGENLRMGMLRRGMKLNDPTAPRYDNKPTGSGDCGGNGLCATCVVSVQGGMEHLTPRAPSERNLLANRFRWRQSCRAYVQLPDDKTDVEVSIALKPRSEGEEE